MKLGIDGNHANFINPHNSYKIRYSLIDTGFLEFL